MEPETEILDVEIVSEEVFQQLALQSEFEENVASAYTDIGLPETDPSFDSLVDEILGDLPTL